MVTQVQNRAPSVVDKRLNAIPDADQRIAITPRSALVFFIALLPFWMVPLAHVASDSETATGFFHYELPYYVANGRAAFERGNGVVYPNPYDPAADSPSIYAHWLPWILGCATVKAGCDPGDVILLATFVASFCFACTTRKLVQHRLSASPFGVGTDMAFVLAMWSGGLLAAAGTIAASAAGTSWFDSVLRFDPGSGLWFLNWGRNAVFPTEAIYHSLAVMCWLSEIRQRPLAANIWLILLATTHPWSGLELLLTINLWRTVQLLQRRNRPALIQLSVSGIVLLVFLGYYKVWLPTFPQHAELQNVWELNWSLTGTSAALAYLPVAIPALMTVKNRIALSHLERTEQFLLCALFVAAGLAFHDRLIKPVQPIHFTRGYVWMPLFLLALPTVRRWCQVTWRRSRRGRQLVVVCVALLVSDNVIFSIVHVQRHLTHREGFYLHRDARAMFADLHQIPLTVTKTAMTDSDTLNYLLPTYANVRPWLGHKFNTPNFPKRHEIWTACFRGNTVHVGEIPDEVQILIVRRSRDVKPLERSGRWTAVGLRNTEWEAWHRIVPPAARR